MVSKKRPPAAEPAAELQAEEAKTTSFAEIMAIGGAGERSTAKMTIEAKGRSLTFEIYTDGRADALQWSKLTSALMWGYTQQKIAKLSKESFGEKIILPTGKPIVIDDPGYLGSVQVLAAVLKAPALSFHECLIAGHQIGKEFCDLCDWAATENGVSEHAVAMMRDLLKNADAPDPSVSS